MPAMLDLLCLILPLQVCHRTESGEQGRGKTFFFADSANISYTDRFSSIFNSKFLYNFHVKAGQLIVLENNGYSDSPCPKMVTKV